MYLCWTIYVKKKKKPVKLTKTKKDDGDVNGKYLKCLRDVEATK